MFDILEYAGADGKSVVKTWRDNLADDRAKAKITLRLERLAHGGFGDHHAVGEGVSELRIDYGPGYRVYYGMVGKTVVLLLCGGDKRKQNADIAKAIGYFKDYKKRKMS